MPYRKSPLGDLPDSSMFEVVEAYTKRHSCFKKKGGVGEGEESYFRKGL